MKDFAVWNKKSKEYMRFFEYPRQAERFIDRLGSPYLQIVDLRKKR